MPRLIKNSKLSTQQVRRIIECFALELTSVQAARHLDINRRTTDRIYRIIRAKIADFAETTQTIFTGEVELDESYFGGKRKYERGRSTKQKVPVFGILKRNGQVYTQIVPDVSRATLMRIIRTKVVPESVIYTDSWRSYDGLIIDGYRHYRINHSQEFAHGKRNHINGIESFWSYAKRKLVKHYGIPPQRFYFYLKEMEFRFNYRHRRNLAKFIEEIVKS